MKNPKRDRIPAWYDLALDGTSLLILVHQEAANALRGVVTESSPIVPALQQELRLPGFIPPTEEQWGFGKVLSIQQGAMPDWIIWKCALPVILGPKASPDGNWQIGFAVSATLQVLFRGLELGITEREADPLFPQLLVVESMLTRAGMHGGSLHATVCPPLCTWLSQQKDNSERPEIVDAMKRVFSHMSGRQDSLDYAGFRAWMRQPKWVNLDCPGDACGLDPENYYDISLEQGYGLAPHNVDNPIQQFTLLTGLAALCQLAREQK